MASWSGCVAGPSIPIRNKRHATSSPCEELALPRLLLKFDSAILKEIPLGSRPVTIGRAPDNEMAIDNLAVSNYHARIYGEAGRLVVEDLNSLNGTFVNDMRVERATLRDGDRVQVGKHQIEVDT